MSEPASRNFFPNREAPVGIRTFLVLAVLLFVAGQVAAEVPASNTLVKAGRLVDPRTGRVISPAAVLIDNGKIKEVGPPSEMQTHAAGDVKTIEVGSGTSLPGLIDSHTYLLLEIIAAPQLKQQ